MDARHGLSGRYTQPCSIPAAQMSSQPSGTLHSWLLNILMTPVCSFFSWFKAVVLEGMGFSVWLSGKDSTCQRQETQVPSLAREDPLEKEMTAYSVLLPGKCHGQRSLAGHSPWGHRESDMTEQLNSNSKKGLHLRGEDAKALKAKPFHHAWL